MKPTRELLKFAKAKAETSFRPNKNNTMQSIRLTADDKSFTLFYQVGLTYIGSFKNEKLGKFFKNRIQYELKDNETGKITATMQRLK